MLDNLLFLILLLNFVGGAFFLLGLFFLLLCGSTFLTKKDASNDLSLHVRFHSKDAIEEASKTVSSLKKLFNFYLVAAFFCFFLSAGAFFKRFCIIINDDPGVARMYVLGKDYIVAKGASELLPKVGKLIDSVSDSL